MMSMMSPFSFDFVDGWVGEGNEWGREGAGRLMRKAINKPVPSRPELRTIPGLKNQDSDSNYYTSDCRKIGGRGGRTGGCNDLWDFTIVCFIVIFYHSDGFTRNKFPSLHPTVFLHSKRVKVKVLFHG